MATAILDRLLHHATTLNIKGERYRLREKKKAGLLGRRAATPAEEVPPMARPDPPGLDKFVGEKWTFQIGDLWTSNFGLDMVIEAGTVRWAEGRRFGVEFGQMQPASEEILSQWLARLAGGS